MTVYLVFPASLTNRSMAAQYALVVSILTIQAIMQYRGGFSAPWLGVSKHILLIRLCYAILPAVSCFCVSLVAAVAVSCFCVSPVAAVAVNCFGLSLVAAVAVSCFRVSLVAAGAVSCFCVSVVVADAVSCFCVSLAAATAVSCFCVSLVTVAVRVLKVDMSFTRKLVLWILSIIRICIIMMLLYAGTVWLGKTSCQPFCVAECSGHSHQYRQSSR